MHDTQVVLGPPGKVFVPNDLAVLQLREVLVQNLVLPHPVGDQLAYGHTGTATGVQMREGVGDGVARDEEEVRA